MQPNAEHNDPHEKTGPGGVQTTTLAVVGLVGVLILAVIFIAGEAFLYRMQDLQQRTEWVRPSSQVQSYRQEQEKKLQTLGYREESGKKILVVPIDRAMELVAHNGLQSAQK